MDTAGLYRHAFQYCLAHGLTEGRINYWKTLPKPSEVEDMFFLAELSWCIFNAGMKEALIRKKWPALEYAFFYFDPPALLRHRDECVADALKIINHPGKVKAIIAAAQKVVGDGPMCEVLAGMTEEQALDYLQSFPFIGSVTKYHVARNVGFDVVKPDRHLVRITKFFKYPSADALVAEMAGSVGEKKGFVDYVLWQWLAWAGPSAYEGIECFG